MAGLQRLTPGRPLRSIEAKTWNAFADATDAVRAAGLLAAPGKATAPAVALTMPGENATGEALTADYPIVRIGAAWSNAEGQHTTPRVRVYKPDADTGASFGVLIGGCPHAEGERPAVRQCVYMGATWCKVNRTDAEHTAAVAEDGNATNLVSAPEGARVLYWEKQDDETTTGLQWAIVVCGPIEAANTGTMIAKIETTIPARSGDVWGSATAALGTLNDDDEWSEVLESVTVYNRTKSAIYSPSEPIFEIAQLINGKWILCSNIQMQTLYGYAAGTTQHVVQCAAGGNGPQWAANAPLTDFRVVDETFEIDVYTYCDGWTNKYTGDEC